MDVKRMYDHFSVIDISLNENDIELVNSITEEIRNHKDLYDSSIYKKLTKILIPYLEIRGDSQLLRLNKSIFIGLDNQKAGLHFFLKYEEIQVNNKLCARPQKIHRDRHIPTRGYLEYVLLFILKAEYSQVILDNVLDDKAVTDRTLAAIVAVGYELGVDVSILNKTDHSEIRLTLSSPHHCLDDIPDYFRNYIISFK